MPGPGTGYSMHYQHKGLTEFTAGVPQGTVKINTLEAQYGSRQTPANRGYETKPGAKHSTFKDTTKKTWKINSEHFNKRRGCLYSLCKESIGSVSRPLASFLASISAFLCFWNFDHKLTPCKPRTIWKKTARLWYQIANSRAFSTTCCITSGEGRTFRHSGVLRSTSHEL